MSNAKELTVSNNGALAAYGDQDTVGEIFNRLMKLHPQAPKLGTNAMRLVAQASVLTGANPLPPPLGEIYVWDQRGNLNIDYYIGYYRRKANEKDTVVWVDEPRTMTDDEKEKHGIPSGAIGGICKGARFSKVKEMVQIGIPYREALDLAGKSETAIVAHKEMVRDRDTKWYKAGDPVDPPAGRTWGWVAAKRAEKAFYRAESLIDSALTDAMERARSVVSDLDTREQHRIERESYTADDANAEFFGYDSGADIVYEDAIDGEYEAVEGEIEPEPEPASVAPDGPDEMDIYTGEPGEFFTDAMQHIPRYEHEKAVKGALKKLGYTSLPKDAEKRLEMFRHLRAYARFRDAGMDDGVAMENAVALLSADEEE